MQWQEILFLAPFTMFCFFLLVSYTVGHALTVPRTESFGDSSPGPTLVTTLSQSSPHTHHTLQTSDYSRDPLPLHKLQPLASGPGELFPRAFPTRWCRARSPDSLRSPAPGRVVLPRDLGPALALVTQRDALPPSGWRPRLLHRDLKPSLGERTLQVCPSSDYPSVTGNSLSDQTPHPLSRNYIASLIN